MSVPEGWSVPFMPWPASVSVFMSVFLMGTLKMLSFLRFGIWAGTITVFYVVYGVHSTYEAEEMDSSETMMEGHVHQTNKGEQRLSQVL